MSENAEQRCAEGAEHMQECRRIGHQPPAAAAKLIEPLQQRVDRSAFGVAGTVQSSYLFQQVAIWTVGTGECCPGRAAAGQPFEQPSPDRVERSDATQINRPNVGARRPLAQPFQPLDIGNVPGPTCGKHARIVRIRCQGRGVEQDSDSNLQFTLGCWRRLCLTQRNRPHRAPQTCA